MGVLCFRIGFVFDCGVVIFTLMGVNSVGIVFFVFRFYGFCVRVVYSACIDCGWMLW